MKIKKYLANNLPQAMSMVRQELGREAIILNTRHLKLGGLFGVFGRPAVEVTAAVNEAERQARRQRREQDRAAEFRLPEIEGTYSRAGVTVESRRSRELPDEPEFTLARQPAPEAITNELAPSGPVVLTAETPQPAKEVAEAPSAPECAPVRLDDAQTRVVMLIGPSGAGKTTTIAKIAAAHARADRTITLITCDTQRVAGVHQLKAYGDILGVETQACYLPAEVSAAVAEFTDTDLILIDTGGQNYQDPRVISELRGLIEAAQPDEVHLVLPCTMSEMNALDACRCYGEAGYNRLLFTKADEATDFEMIAAVIQATEQPVSYLCTGQKVPDDLEDATKETIAALFTGPTQLRRVAAGR